VDANSQLAPQTTSLQKHSTLCMHKPQKTAHFR